MSALENKINDIIESKELAKWIKKHIDELEKSWDIESLQKIWEVVKSIFLDKENKNINKQTSVWDVISDLLRDKKN